ncbi:hypothetical protein KFL_000080600 [Klebsormidium nitens]|uniref:Myb/SANT-like domain-containing protein n=1 Tax=Klebsormidium nitens TaxID=105231 RepID=A0A1Y1HI62_KLENI|nr:hypothetical protein KFL_000080600 [Klebsormidium nitens]|eukprot:GAQ78154.1 hypothetical protein KFL_000080600 [Klebsormidium nitens]
MAALSSEVFQGDFAAKVSHYLTLLDPALFQQLLPAHLAGCLIADGHFAHTVSYDPAQASVQDVASLIEAFIVSAQQSANAANNEATATLHQTPTGATRQEAAPASVAEDTVILQTPLAPPKPAAPGAVPGAVKKPRAVWGVYDVEMLNAQLKEHEEMLRDKSTGIKYRSMSAAEKFERIAERLSKLDPPVIRTPSQVEDKWDRLAADFRKVFDWDKNTPSGKPAYWDMPPDQKKEYRLPPAFSKQLFDSMFWLKERASVDPPLVFDSARQYEVPKAGGKGLDGGSSAGESNNSEEEESPEDSSGVLRKGSAKSGNKLGNKRSRGSSGLSDILRANNDATNQTLKDHEESRNVRHKETIALREKELNLEEKKVAVAERNADQAKETGAGLINALGQLAQAVLQLANK